MSEQSGRSTLLISLGSALVAVPLGTLLAFLLVRTDVPARRFWLASFVVLLFVPLYLQTAGWDAGFGRMGWQGGPGQATWLAGPTAAVWIHGMAGLPWVVLIVAAGLASVDGESEEAALLAGSGWQVLRHVTLRRVTGAIALAVVWMLVTTATESIVTDIYALDTFARKLFVATTGLDQGLYIAEVALGVCIISLLVLLGLTVMTQHAAIERTGADRRPPRFRLKRFRLLALLLIVLVLTVAVAVPIANLVHQAGEESRADGTRMVRTWSAARFGETMELTFREFAKALGWTAVISAAAATLACVAGLPLAWLARRESVWSAPATAGILAGLAVPSPLIAEAVIWLLNRDSPPLAGWLYSRSILAPTLVTAVRGLPAVAIVMWFAFRSIATDQLDTAKIDGAGGLRRFWSVAVPQSVLPLAVGWLISFAIAAGDVTASILVRPPGIDTVAVRVFEMLHAGVDDKVAGLCLVSAIGYTAVGGAIYFFANRWMKKTGAESNPRACL